MFSRERNQTLRVGNMWFVNVFSTLRRQNSVSVCLFTTLPKSYRSDLHENFTRDVSFDKEEAIEYCKSSVSQSGSRNVLQVSSTLQD